MNLRLFDAVMVAAIGLLGLKAIGLWGPAGKADSAIFRAHTLDTREAGDNRFARVLTRARSDFTPRDPEFTGSVTATKPEDQKAADAPLEQRAEAAAKAGVDIPQVGPKPGKSVSLDKGGAGPTVSERELLESLGQRRDELEERARELEVREKLLETAEKKLESRLDELKAMEGKVTAGDRRKVELEEQTAKNLVIMYENMKPKDAARVFDKLGHEVLVPVVLRMNARKMSEVLAAMTSEAAQKLTIALAARGKMGATSAPDLRVDQGANLPAGELAGIDQPAQAKKQ